MILGFSPGQEHQELGHWHRASEYITLNEATTQGLETVALVLGFYALRYNRHTELLAKHKYGFHKTLVPDFDEVNKGFVNF